MPRIVILASTLLHLGFPATPHGNGAANALARAEDVIDSARIELPQWHFSDVLDRADDVGSSGQSGHRNRAQSRGIPTAGRDGLWTATQVSRVLARI